MTTRFTLTVSAGSMDSPLSTDKKNTARNLRNYFHKLLGANPQGTHTVQCGLTQASATATAAAVQVGDTVTVNGQALTATIRTARGTLTCGTAANLPVEDDTFTVGAVTFTLKDTPSTALHVQTSVTASTVATNMAAAINANATTAAAVEAVASSTVVYIKYLTAGTAGNSYALDSSNNTRLAKSAATLLTGTAVANNTFDFHAQFNTATATALAAAINASSTGAIADYVTATSSLAVVTVTSVWAGTVANTIGFVSSNGSRLAVTGSGKLASGADTTFTF